MLVLLLVPLNRQTPGRVPYEEIFLHYRTAERVMRAEALVTDKRMEWFFPRSRYVAKISLKTL